MKEGGEGRVLWEQRQSEGRGMGRMETWGFSERRVTWGILRRTEIWVTKGWRNLTVVVVTAEGRMGNHQEDTSKRERHTHS